MPNRPHQSSLSSTSSHPSNTSNPNSSSSQNQNQSGRLQQAPLGRGPPPLPSSRSSNLGSPTSVSFNQSQGMTPPPTVTIRQASSAPATQQNNAAKAPKSRPAPPRNVIAPSRSMQQLSSSFSSSAMLATSPSPSSEFTASTSLSSANLLSSNRNGSISGASKSSDSKDPNISGIASRMVARDADAMALFVSRTRLGSVSGSSSHGGPEVMRAPSPLDTGGAVANNNGPMNTSPSEITPTMNGASKPALQQRLRNILRPSLSAVALRNAASTSPTVPNAVSPSRVTFFPPSISSHKGLDSPTSPTNITPTASQFGIRIRSTTLDHPNGSAAATPTSAPPPPIASNASTYSASSASPTDDRRGGFTAAIATAAAPLARAGSSSSNRSTPYPPSTSRRITSESVKNGGVVVGPPQGGSTIMGPPNKIPSSPKKRSVTTPKAIIAGLTSRGKHDKERSAGRERDLPPIVYDDVFAGAMPRGKV